MAFMGMFMIFLAVILTILGVSAFIAFVCFLSSGLIMLSIRKKTKDSGTVKRPWYVITLRVIGSIATVPLVITLGLIIYAVIASAIDRRTNLPKAVMNGDYDLAEKILADGADPDVRDQYGRTLLMCIADHNPYTAVDDSGYDYRYDYSIGPSLSGWDDDDDEDIKMMELLLEYGADINATVPDCGYEENHVYEEGGWTDIYANSDHYCGNTPLIYAVRYRSADVVEFMIDNGADVNKANTCGFTPLLMCADMRYDSDDGAEIISMLLEEGADPHAITNFHQDILWLISRSNSADKNEMMRLVASEFDPGD